MRSSLGVSVLVALGLIALGQIVFAQTTTPCLGCVDAPLCLDTCAYANDGVCQDGGPNSADSSCAYGTDCADCGGRPYDSGKGIGFENKVLPKGYVGSPGDPGEPGLCPRFSLSY